jgi:hypothetical protein
MLSLLARLLEHERTILEDVGLLNSTIRAFLTEVGYHTAFAWKWVNGDGCSSMTLAPMAARCGRRGRSSATRLHPVHLKLGRPVRTWRAARRVFPTVRCIASPSFLRKFGRGKQPVIVNV